ncbi:7,8-dihydroneopterin aldolase [Paraliobacillus quinghaiensis]|uniref:7,8-dihydroneopterin aldolase n=1 Tax=Paraliobacillus quinghaiensis TaxID=470815 RepID=A0A917TSQ7_9BACI|nr:dihydroneopterin aldolase [Paraliobacillus quinghaiensis]GGM36388.1 7,8-dihydroneopterin aldolase [Paraliobacillus quinghaiensis]
MDKIYLDKMAFYGYHGLFPEENKLGQRFFVDVILELDLRKAGVSDQMEESINYGYVYQLTQEVVEGKSFKLIEAVAETIASRLLENFSQLKACRVKVNKPDAPIAGHIQAVAVEIYREQSK